MHTLPLANLPVSFYLRFAHFLGNQTEGLGWEKGVEERGPWEGEEVRKAAKTVTSRPWGFPFLGRDLYTDNTFSETCSPHVFSESKQEEDDGEEDESNSITQDWVRIPIHGLLSMDLLRGKTERN